MKKKLNCVLLIDDDKPLTEENVATAIQKYFATHNAP